MPVQVSVESEERAIITILDGSSDISTELLGRITPEYFGSAEAQECAIRIFSLLKAHHEIPSLSVFSEDVSLSDAARDFLKEAQSLPIVKKSDITSLVNILDFHRKYRILLRGIKQLNADAKDETMDTLDKPIEDAEKLLIDLRSGLQQTKLVVAGAGDTSHADAIVEKIIAPDESDSRIYTGFNYFDKFCGGFRKPSVVVISGTTGGGKSVMRTQLCKNMYFDQHLSTCIMSLEMSEEEEMVRLLSNISQVPFEKLERHQMSAAQQVKVLKAWEDFKQVGRDHNARFMFWVPQGGDTTAQKIITFLRPMKLDVIVVDYIGLLSSSGKEDAQWQQLGDMVRDFKVASAALNCCFIILAQFDGDNNRIKYSRAIQEHANILWGWTYGENERETGIVPIQQIKNRNAPSMIEFRLQFLFPTMTILDYQGDTDVPPTHSKPLNSSKPDNSPPKDFKSMKKDLGKFNKTHSYKSATTPSPESLKELAESDL